MSWALSVVQSLATRQATDARSAHCLPWVWSITSSLATNLPYQNFNSSSQGVMFGHMSHCGSYPSTPIFPLTFCTALLGLFLHPMRHVVLHAQTLHSPSFFLVLLGWSNARILKLWLAWKTHFRARAKADLVAFNGTRESWRISETNAGWCNTYFSNHFCDHLNCIQSYVWSELHICESCIQDWTE